MEFRREARYDALESPDFRPQTTRFLSHFLRKSHRSSPVSHTSTPKDQARRGIKKTCHTRVSSLREFRFGICPDPQTAPEIEIEREVWFCL